jgi:hypothetical protein
VNRYNVTIMAGPHYGLNLIVEASSASDAKAQARKEWDDHGVTKHSTVTTKKLDDTMPSSIRRFL